MASEQQEKRQDRDARENQCSRNAPEQAGAFRREWSRWALRRNGWIDDADACEFARRTAEAARSQRLWLSFVLCKLVRHERNFTAMPAVRLEEPEDGFDRHPGRDRAVCGVVRGNKFPRSNRLHGALVEPQSDALRDADLRSAAIGVNQN